MSKKVEKVQKDTTQLFFPVKNKESSGFYIDGVRQVPLTDEQITEYSKMADLANSYYIASMFDKKHFVVNSSLGDVNSVKIFDIYKYGNIIFKICNKSILKVKDIIEKTRTTSLTTFKSIELLESKIIAETLFANNDVKCFFSKSSIQTKHLTLCNNSSINHSILEIDSSVSIKRSHITDCKFRNGDVLSVIRSYMRAEEVFGFRILDLKDCSLSDCIETYRSYKIGQPYTPGSLTVRNATEYSRLFIYDNITVQVCSRKHSGVISFSDIDFPYTLANGDGDMWVAGTLFKHDSFKAAFRDVIDGFECSERLTRGYSNFGDPSDTKSVRNDLIEIVKSKTNNYGIENFIHKPSSPSTWLCTVFILEIFSKLQLFKELSKLNSLYPNPDNNEDDIYMPF